MDEAENIIATLGLEPLPHEGGFAKSANDLSLFTR